jgi:hypothetical protein
MRKAKFNALRAYYTPREIRLLHRRHASLSSHPVKKRPRLHASPLVSSPLVPVFAPVLAPEEEEDVPVQEEEQAKEQAFVFLPSPPPLSVPSTENDASKSLAQLLEEVTEAMKPLNVGGGVACRAMMKDYQQARERLKICQAMLQRPTLADDDREWVEEAIQAMRETRAKVEKQKTETSTMMVTVNSAYIEATMILGLRANATRGEVNKAFASIARACHPDKTREPDVEKLERISKARALIFSTMDMASSS